jgi:hypothetical protein
MPKQTNTQDQKDRRNAEVIESKRKPPLWTVKAGSRYRASFSGPNAKARALAYARREFAEFVVVEKEVPKREQARLDINAGLSESA